MKLLIHSHYFAPSIGGVETIVMSLACALAELRGEDGLPEFDLTLATQTHRGSFDENTLPFRVVRRPGPWRLWSLVREADAVHVAGPSFLVLLLAWIARTPFFVEHHTYQAICPNGLLIHQPDRTICPGYFQLKNYGECRKCERFENTASRAFFKIMAAFPRRALVWRAAANIAVSEHVKRRIGAPRSVVIYHGTKNRVAEGDAQIWAIQEKGKMCFAFVGRLVPEKGISVFIEALARLKHEGHQFEAKLIGDGPERAKTEEQILKLGLKNEVSITGYLSGQSFEAAVANVSVVVMPSVWEETAGLAAMEQMKRGRLVICSDVGGLAEMVGDAGFRVRVGDANDLSDKLREVITNPAIVATLGSRAYEHARAFYSQEKMAEEHGKLYRSFCRTGSPAPGGRR